MRTTIDGAGRVVIPKSLRDRLRLVGGSTLEIEEVDGVIEVRPVPGVVRVVTTPEGPVAVADGGVLDDATVRDVLDQLRR
jgi:AbrB family looped-hinge helix DNA binding protein